MRKLLLCAAISMSLASSACSKKAEREWSPSDHDQLDTPPASRPPATNSPRPIATAPAAPTDVDAFWSGNCARCHGQTGKGDGPAGKALRVPDLSDKQWQAKVADDQIASTIQRGRGAMPAFDVPPPAMAVLVKKVRSFR